jgi:hypothetical protein
MKKELKTEEERIAYNCRKATFLIEKKQENELTAREAMELKLHLAGCYICRVFEEQSILINAMVANLFKSKPESIMLDTTFKSKMKKDIEEKISGRH